MLIFETNKKNNLTPTSSLVFDLGPSTFKNDNNQRFPSEHRDQLSGLLSMPVRQTIASYSFAAPTGKNESNAGWQCSAKEPEQLNLEVLITLAAPRRVPVSALRMWAVICRGLPGAFKLRLPLFIWRFLFFASAPETEACIYAF